MMNELVFSPFSLSRWMDGEQRSTLAEPFYRKLSSNLIYSRPRPIPVGGHVRRHLYGRVRKFFTGISGVLAHLRRLRLRQVQ